jgi:hypothetical protein
MKVHEIFTCMACPSFMLRFKWLNTTKIASGTWARWTHLKKIEKCNIKISKKELNFFIPLHITLILTRVNFQEKNMIVCGLYENEKNVKNTIIIGFLLFKEI